jgi:hypothetical protein
MDSLKGYEPDRGLLRTVPEVDRCGPRQKGLCRDQPQLGGKERQKFYNMWKRCFEYVRQFRIIIVGVAGE